MCSLYRSLPPSLSPFRTSPAPLHAWPPFTPPPSCAHLRLFSLPLEHAAAFLSLVAEGSSLVPLPSVVHPSYTLDSDSHYLPPRSRRWQILSSSLFLSPSLPAALPFPHPVLTPRPRARKSARLYLTLRTARRKLRSRHG